MCPEQLQFFSSQQEVPLATLPSGPLRVLLCGDATLASLSVVATFSKLDRSACVLT